MATNPNPILAFRFDAKHPDALANANAHAARYVTRTAAETRAAMRAIVSRSIDDGIAPRDVANQIRGTLLSASSGSRMVRTVAGLTRPHALAVDNFRRSLQRLVDPQTNLKRFGPKNRGRAQRLRRGGQAAVDRKVQRYADRLLRVRADNIARTEIMGSLNAGALEAGRQAQARGVLQNPIKKWFVAVDDRLCPICRPLSGEIRTLDEPFSIGLQYPPAHPSCRCTASVREAPAPTRRRPGRPGSAHPGPQPLTAGERALGAFRRLGRTRGSTDISADQIFARPGALPPGTISRDLFNSATSVDPAAVRNIVPTVATLSGPKILSRITLAGGAAALAFLNDITDPPRLVFWRGKWYVVVGHHRIAAASLLGMNIRALYANLGGLRIPGAL
jgi:SPP1 gp7 family putative phage head morphogenesis protein